MEKMVGKKMPAEKQTQLLIDRCALKLPLLFQSLVDTYGAEKGRETDPYHRFRSRCANSASQRSSGRFCDQHPSFRVL